MRYKLSHKQRQYSPASKLLIRGSFSPFSLCVAEQSNRKSDAQMEKRKHGLSA